MANTYTSDLGAAEGRIQSLTQAVSSGISGLPGINDALRKAVMEREKTLPGLEQENEAKIKELYSADKRYAETYANPQSGMYIENPMQRQALVSGQKTDIRGELGNILNLIQSRQQTMGNAIDKGMELYKMGLEAQKLELDQAEKTWNRIMEKAKFDASNKGSGNKDAAMAALLRTMIIGKQGWTPTEPKPTYDMSEANPGVAYHSPKGQWEYDATAKDWKPTGAQGGQRYGQDITDILQQYPEIAGTVMSNYDTLFPQNNESDMLDYQLKALASGGVTLDAFGSDTKEALIARAIKQGYNIDSTTGTISKPAIYSGPTGQIGGGVSAPSPVPTPAPTQNDIPDYQDIIYYQQQIDNVKDPLQKADVYQQIITAFPQLKSSLTI